MKDILPSWKVCFSPGSHVPFSVLGSMLAVSRFHPGVAVPSSFIIHTLGFVMVAFRGFWSIFAL